MILVVENIISATKNEFDYLFICATKSPTNCVMHVQKRIFAKTEIVQKKVRRSRVGRFQLFSSEMEDQKKTLKPARLTFQSCNNTSTLDEISHLRDNNSVGVIAFKTMFKSSDRTKSSMFNRLQARSIQGYAFFEVVSQYSSRWFSEERV